MKSKIYCSNKRNYNLLLFIIIIALVFNDIPEILRLNFIAGIMAEKLSIYPIIVGIIYTIRNKPKFSLNRDKKHFFAYFSIFFTILLVSLFWGLFNYPYYDVILSGPIDQVEKLPYVYNKLYGLGIPVTKILLLSIWMIARPIKSFLILYLLTFCVSFMIYSWYRDNCDEGIHVLTNGVFVTLLIICLYGFLDMFYLAGNEYAKNVLIHLNPIVHSIKSGGTWWPPLLWNNQLRSIFAEPSYVGIYMAFGLPFLWMRLFLGKGKRPYLFFEWLINFICMFFLFLTKARTATVLLFGILTLLILLCLLYLPFKKKQMLGIICCCGLAFLFSLGFLNYIAVKRQNEVSVVTASGYLEDTVGSLSDIDKRSNRSRYSIMIADFRIGLDHPILGVGIGLRNAYIPEYLPDKEHLSNETKMWIKNQKKKGIMKSGFPKLGEYTSRFAETGLIGVVLFLIPPIYLLWELFNSVRRKSKVEADSTQEIFFMISLMGILASGIGDSLNITYAYWIMLGLGYTILRKNREEQHESA